MLVVLILVDRRLLAQTDQQRGPFLLSRGRAGHSAMMARWCMVLNGAQPNGWPPQPCWLQGFVEHCAPERLGARWAGRCSRAFVFKQGDVQLLAVLARVKNRLASPRCFAKVLLLLIALDTPYCTRFWAEPKV